MAQRSVVPSAVLTLLALAIVYVLGTSFFTAELERLVETTITPHIRASPGVRELNREIFSGLDQFMASNRVRAVGFACLAIVILLTLLGLMAKKKGLASLGTIGFFLPIYAYFVIHMSFLAGLGILSALWLPFWGDLVKLGDIAFLPYMLLVYPFSLVGVDLRLAAAYALTDLGLLVFVLGVVAWFYARFQRIGTADFWIYRLTRHPQYLGWILWSYGLMLRASLSRGIPLQYGGNPGASLPWVISSLTLVCIALSEETGMRQERGLEYERYQRRAPLLLPLPALVSRWISAPLRLTLRKDHPESGREIIVTFVLYLALIVLLSLPFAAFRWPQGGWAVWPF